MENRINIIETLPQVTKALYTLSGVIENSALTKTHKELLKIRASQINGCAFCIDMHTKDALKYGETQQRIFLLNAWRETSLFTAEEKAVLAIAEEITLISNHGLTDTTYALAKSFFTDEYIALLVAATVTINAWNRLAISSQLEPGGV
ncbi:MAG: carboxymuconolactone decarboxylase family protein [Bacteroidia bacterium]